MCLYDKLHEGHKIVRIGDAKEGIQLDQRDVLDELKTVTECANDMCRKLKKKMSKMNENTIQIKKKIVSTQKELISFIESSLDKILKEMESEREETEQDMSTRVEELEVLVEKSNALITCVEKKESGEGPYANLWNISEMIKMTTQLVGKEIERLDSVHFEYLLKVDDEKEKLKTLVDKFIVSKKMISIQPRYPIDFDKLAALKSEQSKIKVEGSTNYGSIYDQRRKIVVSVTGIKDKMTNLMVMKLKGESGELEGDVKNVEGVIPFESGNVRPIYDGIRYIYFVGIKDGLRNQFGRINIEKIEEKTFETLPSLPDKEKDNKRQFIFPSGGVYHFGKIYVQDSERKIWQFSISVKTTRASSFTILISSFFTSFTHRTTNGLNFRSNYQAHLAS